MALPKIFRRNDFKINFQNFCSKSIKLIYELAGYDFNVKCFLMLQESLCKVWNQYDNSKMIQLRIIVICYGWTDPISGKAML